MPSVKFSSKRLKYIHDLALLVLNVQRTFIDKLHTQLLDLILHVHPNTFESLFSISDSSVLKRLGDEDFENNFWKLNEGIL